MSLATPRDVERYLHEHIPLSQAMGVRVVTAGPEGVTLSAPLAPNINHRETVFGGSASALAILASWTLIHLRLSAAGIRCRLVIQRNSMSYSKPILDEFAARTLPLDDEAWETFLKMYDRWQRARIRVRSVLECRGEQVGELEGDFVALGN
jgi:thioesterase domain-containing protein